MDPLDSWKADRRALIASIIADNFATQQRSRTSMQSFFNRKEAEFSDKPIRIVVTLADMEPKFPDKSSYLLDLDKIDFRPDEPIPLAQIGEIMEDLKDRHRAVFESLITPDARKLFDGE